MIESKNNLPGSRLFHCKGKVELYCGKNLYDVTLAYETKGTLSSNKDNVILIFHGFSGNTHFSSNEDAKNGWWENLVGLNSLNKLDINIVISQSFNLKMKLILLASN